MNPISVLLVDNNPRFLRIAKRFLEAHDDVAVIGIVREGDEILAQVLNLRPDIVLIDMSMPSLSGLEVIPRLRTALPDMGIIALALLGTDGYRQAVLEAGVDAFVPKAAIGADLLPAIRRVMQVNRSLTGETDAAA